jgi:hypothetical protein
MTTLRRTVCGAAAASVGRMLKEDSPEIEGPASETPQAETELQDQTDSARQRVVGAG